MQFHFLLLYTIASRSVQQKYWTTKQEKKIHLSHQLSEQFPLHVITTLKFLINSSRMTAKIPRLLVYCFQEKLHCTTKYGIDLSYLVPS